jgi:hypothetical protein
MVLLQYIIFKHCFWQQPYPKSIPIRAPSFKTPGVQTLMRPAPLSSYQFVVFKKNAAAALRPLR